MCEITKLDITNSSQRGKAAVLCSEESTTLCPDFGMARLGLTFGGFSSVMESGPYSPCCNLCTLQELWIVVEVEAHSLVPVFEKYAYRHVLN